MIRLTSSIDPTWKGENSFAVLIATLSLRCQTFLDLEKVNSAYASRVLLFCGRPFLTSGGHGDDRHRCRLGEGRDKRVPANRYSPTREGAASRLRDRLGPMP